MKKNRMMRLASMLMIAVLMTTCTISGTFAKYVTEAKSQDSARVAKWGFDTASIDISDLFESAYNGTVESGDSADVIAPGTTNTKGFGFAFDKATTGINAPEVDYKIEVSTAGSVIAENIKQNPAIQWKLDGNEWGSWDDLLTSIQGLSQATVEAGNLPTHFGDGATHSVSWQWVFDNGNDVFDTNMGNMDELDDVKLVITITATQID